MSVQRRRSLRQDWMALEAAAAAPILATPEAAPIAKAFPNVSFQLTWASSA